MTTEVRLYRKINPDGTSKDWAVPLHTTGEVVRVYFGRTGSTLRLAETPQGHCRNGSLKEELEARILEKLGKGYHVLGVFSLADNRRDLTPLTDTAAVSVATVSTVDADPAKGDPSAPAPALYWRWHSSDPVVEAACQHARDNACVDIAKRLAAVGWDLSNGSSNTEGSAIWSVMSRDTHQGIVPVLADQAPRIAFFLLLAQQCGALRVANEQGQIITTWPSELPIEAHILETLGLRPKDLSQLLTGLPSGDWFY